MITLCLRARLLIARLGAPRTAAVAARLTTLAISSLLGFQRSLMVISAQHIIAGLGV